MSYIPPAQFILRYDSRIVGDLVSDTGTRVSAAGLLTDPALQAILDDASGMIDAACFKGKRYSATDLAALTGQDLAFLYRLNADIAFGELRLRRGKSIADYPQVADAMAILELLRNGEVVFAVLGAEAAGLPTGEFPALTNYANWNMMRDYANRYFPQRRSQSL